jgi:CelD/BcsL family acetyltransferase involved in cellulose biosynthesis
MNSVRVAAHHAAPRAAGEALICRVHSNAQALIDLAGKWDELLERSPERTPWQSRDFLRLWWRHCAQQRELRLVVVERRSRPCLILPLQLGVISMGALHVRALEPIGMPDDINRPRLAIGEFDPDAYRSAFGALWRIREEWDLLRLDEQPAQGAELEALAEFADDHDLALRRAPQHACPSLRLDVGWKEYLLSRGRRLRKGLRNARHRLEAIGSVHTQIFESVAEIDRGFGLLLDVHARSWKGAAHLGLSRSDGYREFYREWVRTLAGRGRARIQVLFCGDAAVAATFGVTEGSTYHSAQIAHDEAYAHCSPGTLLESMELEALMRARRHATYDFLGAALANKQRWTDTSIDTFRVLLFNRSARSRWLDWYYFRARPLVRRALRRQLKARPSTPG